MHHDIDPGQPARQCRIPDVDHPPGHPGYVTAMVVDRDNASDLR